MKKAQLTMFMLLGIVLLIVFGLLFYSTGVIAEYQLNRRANKITEELLKTTALEYYVTVCLDDSAKKGLNLVGRQGGVIYKEQGGWLDKTDFIPFEVYNKTYNVTYTLTNPDFKPTSHPPPPEYPYERFYDGRKWFNPRDNYYGTNKLLYLCDKDGPNKKGIFKFAGLTCETTYLITYNLPGKTSIQEQLAIFIANETKRCVNFSSFISKFGYNITEGENLSAEVVYGDKDVIVNLKYPIDIKLTRKDKVTKFLNFRTKLNVRFKTIYNLAYSIIENEINDINFKVEEDYSTKTTNCVTYGKYNKCWKEGLDIRKFKDVCKETGLCLKYNDLIQIIDSESLIKGNPFIFQFGIENRHPALDEIRTFLGIDYDMVVVEGQTIKLDPIGYDPDEDNLTYNYSGWKEDYDEYFDFDEFNADPQTCNLKTCVKIIQDYSPHNWTESEEFKLTQQNSTYKTNHSDIGVHNVTVSVHDNEGLKDWQNIIILVNDKPVVQIQVYNPYDLTGEQLLWASIEDPYTLDATGTTVIFDEGVEYRWIDSEGEFDFITHIPIHKLPDDNPDIMTITLKNFTIPQPRTLSLTVMDGIIEAIGETTEIKAIEVKECLPHRKESNPYPYNSPFTDDFQANHTCCKDDGKYKPKATECFREEYYTCKPVQKTYPPADAAVKETGTEGKLEYILPTDIEFKFANFPSSGDNNDIYLRTYTQQCSEKRGNACSGKITDNYELKIPCKDKTSEEDETCQGPCNPNTEGCTKAQCPGLNIPENPPQCHKYVAEHSFEKDFLKDPNADGICNKHWKCSSLGGYDNDGDYLAQAYCGGGECKTVLVRKAIECNKFNGHKISVGPPYTQGDIECNYNGIASVQYDCSDGKCVGSEWDLDKTQRMCIECGKEWVKSGATGVGDYPDQITFGCCGDDTYEEYKFYWVYGGNPNENDNACCKYNTDCVFNHKCYNNGAAENVDGDSRPDTCTGGRWTITT